MIDISLCNGFLSCKMYCSYNWSVSTSNQSTISIMAEQMRRPNSTTVRLDGSNFQPQIEIAFDIVLIIKIMNKLKSKLVMHNLITEILNAYTHRIVASSTHSFKSFLKIVCKLRTIIKFAHLRDKSIYMKKELCWSWFWESF